MNIKKFDSRFEILPIAKIVQENEMTKTFVFNYSLGGKPGQFLMMWIPGFDEKHQDHFGDVEAEASADDDSIHPGLGRTIFEHADGTTGDEADEERGELAGEIDLGRTGAVEPGVG